MSMIRRRSANNPNNDNDNVNVNVNDGIGGRFICLVDDYEMVKGPYVFALFDQLFEQTNHMQKNIA